VLASFKPQPYEPGPMCLPDDIPDAPQPDVRLP
jgi:hypothetical protein